MSNLKYGDHSPDTQSSNRTKTAVFAMNGEYWTVGYIGKTFPIKAIKGFSYIDRLLQHPGEEFHALDLLSGPGAGFVPDGDAGEMLDAHARQDYKRTLDELRESLEDARELGNSERCAEIQSQIDYLARELARAIGLRGRIRRAGSAAERARLNVTRAIKTAIQKIAEHDSDLGAVLDRSIHTGLFCSFITERQTAIRWQFSLEDAKRGTVRTEIPSIPAKRPPALQHLADRTRFVGREREQAALRLKSDEAKAGNGTVFMISGPPGIGKTRIAYEICSEASANGFLTLIGACYDSDSSVPFNPFVEILEAALAQQPDVSLRRAMLGDDAAELARLMPQLRQAFEDIPPPLEVAPEYSRRLLLNSFVAFLTRVALTTPLLLLIDDLQWADEGTLLLLSHLARTLGNMPVMIIGTFRDKDFPASGPLAAALDTCARLHVLEHMTLSSLSESAVGQMLAALGHREAPQGVVKTIYSGTDGNPFFVEELFRHLLERGKLFDSQGRFFRSLEISETELPQSVRLVIGRRLATVTPDTSRMLDLAAVIGNSFTFSLVEAVSGMNPDRLVDLFEEAEEKGLISSSLVYPQVRFWFSHWLIRQSVLAGITASRRQRLHARVGSVLEEISSNPIDHIDDLAHHFWSAGDAVAPEKTVGYLASAARQALGKSAYDLALTYLGNALEVIKRLTPTRQRDELEVDLLLNLGVSLLARKGWYVTELAAAYVRARELCEVLGDDRRRFFAVFGLWSYHLVKGEHPKSSAYASELLTLARQINVYGMKVEAHWAEGCSRFFAGDFLDAHRNFEAAITLYDRDRDRPVTETLGQDPCVSSLCFDAMTLWHLGLTQQAERQALEALRMARELGHPFTLVWCMTMLSKYYSVRRDFEAVGRITGEAIPMNRELGFQFWQECLFFYKTIGLAFSGQLDERSALGGGSKGFAAAGYALAHSWATANLAEAFGRAGRYEVAEGLLAYAFNMMERNQERYAESELYRVKGELAVKGVAESGTRNKATALAVECFQKALKVARQQQARMLELRAANSFATLLLRLSRLREARELLEEVCQPLDEARTTPEYIFAMGLREAAQTTINAR